MRYLCWGIAALFALAVAATFKFAFDTASVRSAERFDNPHKNIPCTDCHPFTADLNAGTGINTEYRQQCERCHQARLVNPSGIPLNFHSTRDRACRECHSFHKTEQITAAKRSFLVSFENSFQRGQCFCCHGPRESLSGLSPDHRTAAVIFHSDFAVLGKLSVSQACLICHSQTAAQISEEIAHFAQDAPRFKEHGSHPVGVEVVPGAGEPGNAIADQISQEIQLFNGRIECPSCHSLSAGYAKARLVCSSQNELCRACHKVD
ncbi:MAG: hypothetical protein AB1483_12060 [Candidatus Zixiibacteriota bacterium]